MAAESSGSQGKSLGMHDAVYEHPDALGEEEIRDDYESRLKSDVPGTPTFY